MISLEYCFISEAVIDILINLKIKGIIEMERLSFQPVSIVELFPLTIMEFNKLFISSRSPPAYQLIEKSAP